MAAALLAAQLDATVPAAAITADPFTAYVAQQNNNAVYPIATQSDTVGSPIPVGTAPRGIAITPDNKTAYAGNNGGTTVTAITLATNTVAATISVGHVPWGVAITPDARTAYVTTDAGVVPIDVATNTAGTLIPAGNGPQGIAITPDGKTAYVTDFGSNTVTPINLATNTPGAPILVGNQPYDVAITPDGASAFVTNQGDGTVTPISIATNTPRAVISLGASFPEGIAIAPNVAGPPDAFVADNGFGRVFVLDTSVGGGIVTSVTGLNMPSGVAISPDGTSAYVSNVGNSSVTPIDIRVRSYSTRSPLPVGSAGPGPRGPRGIAITRYNTLLTTKSSGSVDVGGTITDTATIGNAIVPKETLTFSLFGPDNATCTGPPIFASTKTVNGAGQYTSDSYTASTPGTYRWVARYSGDRSNAIAGPTACNDAAESVVVTPAAIVPESQQPALLIAVGGLVMAGIGLLARRRRRSGLPT